MIETNELIKDLEMSIVSLKNAPMLIKAKHAENCIDSALTAIKVIALNQQKQTAALTALNSRLEQHVKTGK